MTKYTISHGAFVRWLYLVSVFFLASCSASTSAETPILSTVPTWQGITPGVTSVEEVIGSLGLPVRSEKNEKTGDYEVLAYPDEFGSNSPHFLQVDATCNCISHISVAILSQNEYILLEDVFADYGEPEIVVGAITWQRTSTFVYARQGIAVVAQSQRELENAIVFEIEYFVPITTEEYMQTWGGNLPLWVPSSWEAYAYQP